MKLKPNSLSLRIKYNNTNPLYVNILIKALRELNIPIYNRTETFDPDYPYLGWDGSVVTQYIELDKSTSSRDIITNSIEEFIAALTIPDEIHMKLTDDYNAVITLDKVKVGCQEIPFDKVKELYDNMVALRD